MLKILVKLPHFGQLDQWRDGAKIKSALWVLWAKREGHGCIDLIFSTAFLLNRQAGFIKVDHFSGELPLLHAFGHLMKEVILKSNSQ